MRITSEKATQKSITRPHLSVHHTSFFLWALCQELVNSTTQRFVASSGAGLPFLEISEGNPRSSSRSRVAETANNAAAQVINTAATINAGK